MACVYASCYDVYLVAQNIHALLCLCMFTGVLLHHSGGHCEHLPAVQKHSFFLCFSEIEKGKGFGPAA